MNKKIIINMFGFKTSVKIKFLLKKFYFYFTVLILLCIYMIFSNVDFILPLLLY
jgi:hypothetical protein